MSSRFPAGATIALVILSACRPAAVEQKRITMVVSESFASTGLPRILVKRFADRSDAEIRLNVADHQHFGSQVYRGAADVAIADASDLLGAIRAAGPTRIVRTFAYDDFVIVGPSRDPARVQTATTAAEAFHKIVRNQQTFLSSTVPELRRRETEIWAAAEMDPLREQRYRICRGDAAAVLREASRRNAYTFTDRATLESVPEVHLIVLLQHTPMLRDDYTVVLIARPDKNPYAVWFVHWLTSRRGREIVDAYRYEGRRRMYTK